MLEYVFFEDETRKRFQELLREHGVGWSLEGRQTETLVVIDEAGLDDDLAERIEAAYDELFVIEQATQRRGVALPSAPSNAPALTIRLADGRTLRPRLPPDLEGRVAAALAPQDLQRLAEALAAALAQEA